ncbi:MAG: CTP synthase [Chitinophagaceae bacterium]|nr:CTP synthase [Chitinophagaceae bacterium]
MLLENTKSTKYIFITGGVTSSLGKGIIAASLAKLLQERGLSVTIQKFDPYINIDPGTLNPIEHGECFVTEDGAETDLDLGHYERFLNIYTSQANNITTGRIYYNVIQKERNGYYKGKTVQVVPHITDEIKEHFFKLGNQNKYDIIITEIGGTVGDIESLPFIEAVRQAKHELGGKNCVCIHLTLVPYLIATGELKTKPTQHSVKALLELGIQPDILVCRTEEHHLNEEIRKKIALFGNVPNDCVIEAINVETIYDVPLLMQREKLDKRVLEKLYIDTNTEIRMEAWESFVNTLKNYKCEIKIALIGKYVQLKDSYKSISESLIHGGVAHNCRVNIVWIHSEEIDTKNIHNQLQSCNGILVAPGFGERGWEGKLLAVQYAREHKIPFLGICLGFQSAVVEFARNILLLPDASSTEMNEDTKNPVINLMEEQKKVKQLGGTMRLGAYNCTIKRGTKTYHIYKNADIISERHRHRYEFNNAYSDMFEKAGFIITGKNEEMGLVEIMELQGHPWFIGCQFHPELKSTVLNPHPLFVDFVRACLEL